MQHISHFLVKEMCTIFQSFSGVLPRKIMCVHFTIHTLLAPSLVALSLLSFAMLSLVVLASFFQVVSILYNHVWWKYISCSFQDSPTSSRISTLRTQLLRTCTNQRWNNSGRIIDEHARIRGGTTEVGS